MFYTFQNLLIITNDKVVHLKETLNVILNFLLYNLIVKQMWEYES